MPGYFSIKPKPKPRHAKPKPKPKPRKDLVPTVGELINASGRHTVMVSLLKKAKLLNALHTSDNITVFAPTDEAFAKAPYPENLKNTLLKHVLQYSKAPPPKYQSMKSFSTLSGERIPASKVQRFMKNPLRGSNGVVFITSVVL